VAASSNTSPGSNWANIQPPSDVFHACVFAVEYLQQEKNQQQSRKTQPDQEQFFADFGEEDINWRDELKYVYETFKVFRLPTE